MKQILVPIDCSEGAHQALQVAVTIAGALGAKLILLEVIEEEGPLPTISYRLPEGTTDRTAFLARERFKSLRPVLENADVPWVCRVAEGAPPEEICRLARDLAIDLIVMGRRGLGVVGRLVLGSVSDYVVHHAPCHVLIAHQTAGSAAKL